MVLARYLFRSFPFLFGSIWALVGTPFLLIAVFTWRNESYIQKHGIPAEATVVEKLHTSSSNKSSTYALKYVFSDRSRQEHIRSTNVPWETWRQYRDGDTLPIIYLPESPEKSRLDGDHRELPWILPLVFGGFGLIFAPVGWYLAVRGFRNTLRSLELLRSGSVAKGEVTDIQVDLNVRINRRHPCYLRYRFKAPEDGAVHEGRSPNLPFKLQGRWKIGDDIAVVYDPMDPSRNEADVFGLRK
jgi:hypothetical protein